MLLACGSNAKGQLGVGSIDDQHTFTPCLFSTSSRSHKAAKSSAASTNLNSRCPGHILSAVFGANHTLLLIRDEVGETAVWGSGDSARGQLGPRMSSRISSPRTHFERLELPDPLRKGGVKREAVHVAASWETSYVVYRATTSVTSSSDQSLGSDVLLAYGANDFGNLGQAMPAAPPLPPSRPRPTASKAKKSNHLNALPVPLSSPPSYNGVSFASAIRASGLFPSLPPDNKPPSFHIQYIAAGLQHVICVLRVTALSSTRDIIVGWGASRNGQLALREDEGEPNQPANGSSSSTSIPTPSSSSVNSSDSTSSLRKPNGYPPFLTIPTHLYTIPTNEEVISLACGQHHSVVLLRSIASAATVAGAGETKLLVGGSNRKGQLDFSQLGREKLDGVEKVGCTWNATFLQCRTAESKSREGETFQTPRGELIGVGRGEKGQLGVSGGSAVNSSSPTPVEFPFALVPPSLSLQRHDSDPVYSPTNPLETRSVESFACGSEHVLALLSCPSQSPSSSYPNAPSSSINSDDVKTEVWGWGWNEHGNLGLGHTEDVTVPVRLRPAASSSVSRGIGKVVGGRIRGAWAGNGTSWLYVEDY